MRVVVTYVSAIGSELDQVADEDGNPAIRFSAIDRLQWVDISDTCYF